MEITELPKCERSERYVLGLILSTGEAELLQSLAPEHFACDWNAYLFRELRLCAEAGTPFESAALARWFTSPPAKSRAATEGVENLPALVGELTKNHVVRAHKDYYLGILNKERMNRGMILIAMRWIEKVRYLPDEPIKTLRWCQEQMDNKLLPFGFEAFPGEFENE